VARLVGVEQLLAGVEVNKLGVLCGDHSSRTYKMDRGKETMMFKVIVVSFQYPYFLSFSRKYQVGRFLTPYPHDE
jgi:hypothetical protein